MKSILPIFFILFIQYSFSQERVESGIDSLRNIEWTKVAITLDENENMSNYELFERNLEPSDRIVIFTSKPAIKPSIVFTNNVPESCMNWVHHDSTMAIAFKYGKHSLPNSKQIDSFKVVDQQKLDQYYLDNASILQIDTLYVSDKIDFSSSISRDLELLNRTLYYYDQKHNYEFAYYKVSELKGVYITDHFRLKYEGWWKFGEKHGKWKEYDKTGKLVAVKKYKYGKLIRSRSFD